MKKKQETRGGVRIAGPGKKIGRPSGRTKASYATYLPFSTIEWLQTLDNAAKTINEALNEYRAKHGTA